MFSTANVLSGQSSLKCSAETGATLIQKVVDRATRIPLRDALVTATWRVGAPREQQVHTDSTGTVTLCVPAQQVVTLRVVYAERTAPPLSTVVAASTTTTHTAFIDAPGSLLRGRVVDHGTGTGVAQVAVRIANTSLSTLTDVIGRFVFERVPSGRYQLVIEHIAYLPTRTPLEVVDQDLDAVVRVSPAVIPVQAVIVTAFSRRLELVGFYERQKRGVGHFIGRKQIDAMNVQAASDLLRAVPSLRLIPESRRSTQRNVTVGRRGNCRFAYIVDGSRTLPDFEIDFLTAPAVEGIEVYNGLAEVPSPFRAHATTSGGVSVCGVIAIWTRNSR